MVLEDLVTTVSVTEERQRLHGVISNSQQWYIDFYFNGLANSIISFIGIWTNVVNVVVFLRLGLKEGVTITLLSLSVSDIGVNLTCLLTGLCYMLNGVDPRSKVDYFSLMYVAFGWVHSMFFEISMYTTVFLSLERCLCVVIPFKFKGLVTPLRTTVICVLIYTMMFLFYCPIYFTHGLSWQHDPRTNSTRLLLWQSPSRTDIEEVNNVVDGIILPTIAQLTIITCSYLLVRALLSSASFRKQATSSGTDTSVAKVDAKRCGPKFSETNPSKNASKDSREPDSRGQENKKPSAFPRKTDV